MIKESGPWHATIPDLVQKAHSIWGQPASGQSEAYAIELAGMYIDQIDRGSLLGPASTEQVATTVTESVPRLIAVKLCEKYGARDAEECFKRYGGTS